MTGQDLGHRTSKLVRVMPGWVQAGLGAALGVLVLYLGPVAIALFLIAIAGLLVANYRARRCPSNELPD